MPRTSSAKITAWGTPPEPQPTGWDAVKIELGKRPGEWANVGEYSPGSARKIASEKVPNGEGFESRIVPSEKSDGRVDLWVRVTGPDQKAADAVDAKVAELAAQDSSAKARVQAKRQAAPESA